MISASTISRYYITNLKEFNVNKEYTESSKNNIFKEYTETSINKMNMQSLESKIKAWKDIIVEKNSHITIAYPKVQEREPIQ